MARSQAIGYSAGLIVGLASLLAAWPLAAATNPALLQALREDAELTDVVFVDAQTGWAVGDRGVIWHTADGGQTWRLQDSGSEARLESVYFLDARQGWAAGGQTQPGTHQTSGILLRTRDGGRRWEPEPRLLLPALRKVKFLTPQVGWVLGEASPLFPSALFSTDNGGRTWTPASGYAPHGWLAGDFVDPNSGALAGRQGSLAAVRRRGIEASPNPGFGLRSLRKMLLDATGQGWLVGDGALVLTTEDLGHTWQLPPGALPEFVDAHFDWRAVATQGPHCWIAGAPGSRLLHSPDSGRTWQLHATGQSLPLSGLAFADTDHGWAVGALGSILATVDGGRTWKRQRGGGARAALLGIYSEADDVPLELLARLSGGDGYLGVVEILNRRDVEGELPEASRMPERLREAITRVGGSQAGAAWQFPLRQKGLVLNAEQLIDGWNRSTDGQGLETLEAYVVRQIRTWRPEVLFTHGSAPRGEDPLGHLINQVVLRAVEKAGDATRFTEQASQAGLDPWKVKKVYTGANSQTGGTQIETAQLVPRLGRSLADQSALSRGLVATGFSPSPPALGFRLSLNTLSQIASDRDFFSGIVLHPGGDARRALPEPAFDSLDLLRRAAQKQRNVEAVLERADEDPQQGTQLLAQLGDLVGSLEGPMAGRLLFQMGLRYFKSGQWDLAAESFDLLATRYPEHPLTPSALVWLAQYWSSGEAAWRSQSQQRFSVARTSDSSGEAGEAGLRRASSLAVDDSALNDRLAKAAAIGKILETTQPAISVDPGVRFPLAVAWRRQGLPRDAERFFLHLRNTRPRDAWWACADGERWLSEPRGSLPPKSLWPCRPAAGKPRLDGRLDEPLWQAAQRTALQSPLRDDAAWPAVALLAYDEGFLYLAASCRQAPTIEYAAAEGPRPRDADLAGHDRVEFCFDIDRDFATNYRLVIDHRGWTAEDCWGDRSWNPDWFVAAQVSEGVWTVEAAIPLEELSGEFPAANTVWAAGVQRIAPQAGFQSWTTPAAIELRPEGFGYLMFE